MSELGIYFGSRVVDIAETKGKKLLNSIQIPLSTVSSNELDEKVPTEIKLAAAFNDTFRRNKIEAKEAVLCLSGKDLIIRTFEIPVLPNDELQGAISFEAKKYIPFKVEELISDYQVELDRQSHTNIVLFIGIKKKTFDRYFSILSQLNIKINAIEYAGFSVLRILKLSGVGNSGIMGVLCLDSQGQDETSFTVLENGFPLFSRDINLSEGPDGLGKVEEAVAPEIFLDKLKAEIRVSLDYYHRKFPAKPIQNIFIISGLDSRQGIETLISEMGLTGRFIDITRIIGKPMVYSSSIVKSYSSAIAKQVVIKVRPNLISAKAKVLSPGGEHLGVGTLLKGLKLDIRVIIAGILICAGVFLYGIYQALPLKRELGSVINKRISVVRVSPDSSYEALNTTVLQYRKTLNNLSNLLKKQLYITETLDIMPRSLPAGLWLTKFSFGGKQQDGGGELILEGESYLKDSDKEFQAVNKFLDNLKNSPGFTKYFKYINLVSIDRAQFLKDTATTFLISCKTYKDKK